jgi:hypothetical protein
MEGAMQNKSRRETWRFQFSKIAIDALEPPRKGRMTFFDATVSGLALAIYPSGARMFYWVRWVDSRTTWKTLGNFPDVSVENAREAASWHNAALSKWKEAVTDLPQLRR